MLPPVVAGHTVRTATSADAEDVLRLALASDIAEIGHPDYDLEEARADLEAPGREPVLVLDQAGRPVAYCWTEAPDGAEAVEVDVVTPPEVPEELGLALVDAVLARARDRAAGRPIRTWVVASEGGARRARWWTAVGMRPVRRFSRMEIRHTAPPEVPPAPPGVEVRLCAGESDQRQVHRILTDAFSEHFGSTPEPYDLWCERQSGRGGFDLSLWWLADVDGEPAAAIIGRRLSDLGWVQGVGTLSPFRGRGAARQLLQTAFRQFWDRDLPVVGLGVDTDNVTSALRLYESVGMGATIQYDALELAPGSH